MMVKPADADGDVEMDGHASTDDAVDPHAAAVRETSQEEEEEEEDAMAALLGVGREIGSSGDGADGDDRGANAPEPAAGPGAHGHADDEDMDEDDTAEGSPERCADAPAFPRHTAPPITRGLLPPGLPTFPPDLSSSFTNTHASNASIDRQLTSPSPPHPSLKHRQPTGPPPANPDTTRNDDMDESAKMLMLLGELGAEDSPEDSDEAGKTQVTPSKRKKPERPSNPGNVLAAPQTHVANGANGSALAGTQSGPVGEWLKAEGEARMKMADHRRLIYRWTNAIYRLLGMKIPRGMGSLFDKGEKNKREKFDRFLSYYYGTETFEPGTYWYNNADTIQFFIELVRIATCNRTVLEPITIQKLFRKKDPTRQASTWIMVQEELDKTNVTAAELRALFEGPPRS